MAERFVIVLIRIYQGLFSILLKHLFGVSRMCRFTPSCSEYAVRMIQRHGLITGIRLAGAQLLKCHPFGGNYGPTL